MIKPFTETQRRELADILEQLAIDGMDGPRDLDVAIDAIEQLVRWPQPCTPARTKQ